MTQRQLNDFAQSRGLVCLGRTLTGVWDGRPFVASARSGRREVLLARISCARGPEQKAVRQAQLPTGCRLSAGRKDLRLRCCAAEEELFERFCAAMDAAAALLKEGHAGSEEVCALCGEEDWDSFALVKKRYVPVHQDCCERLRHRAQANAALNASGGSYLTGWLGALAGGLAGLLPTALTVWVWGQISAWLCLLIPLGAYHGYRLCRGRMDRMAVAATVVSSLAQVFLLEQMRYYQGFVAQGIFPLVFASTAHYFVNVPLKEMLRHTAQPLEFVTLGSVCALCMADAGNLDRALDCDTMLDSLTERENAVAARVREAWAAELAPTAAYIPASAVPLPAQGGPAPADASAEEAGAVPESDRDAPQPVPVVVEYGPLQPGEEEPPPAAGSSEENAPHGE